MWCLVSQANSVILEVQVDPKAIGQECLEKVMVPGCGPQACDCLGISKECDYFGLKYQNAKGEELWLNLRNPIERQTGGGVAPLRFALRVKFWVPPHLLLQEATRHQFYLHSRLELVEGRLKVSDWSSVARLVALIAQAEGGDYDALLPPHALYSQCCQIQPIEPCEAKPQDFLHRIVQQHKEIKGMKASTAEYWLLKEVSNLDTFGQEMFHSKFGYNGVSMIGVGPHGITVYRGQDEETQNIPYTAIQSATSQRRMFHLVYLSLDGEETSLDFKLDSSQSASGLYRAITEKHAFYSCETVRSAVTAQFIRDLKGTIISIFNEDSTLGKKYVFDIRRTCREVYDNARRALYCEEANIELPVENEIVDRHDCDDCQNRKCKESRECLARLLDAMLCRICMDRTLDTALFPCGHAVACLDCARRCERCPLCRADIGHCRTIYLPIELTHVDKQNPKSPNDAMETTFVPTRKPTTERIAERILTGNETNNNNNNI
ncbi:E3 ubiquitin-protein ligase MYLIP isoform X3 [Cephus cinctus]|uniref:RING-type E3 ubiquitin transferase n=1 Tax=Cephus cinctus TaxID=211228 RepID=A0AAJ7RL03_CEPCN|nr:E3 ubiquitin-protein ligase MYLIP isoform X3 [Cephus cinctus]